MVCKHSLYDIKSNDKGKTYACLIKVFFYKNFNLQLIQSEVGEHSLLQLFFR